MNGSKIEGFLLLINALLMATARSTTGGSVNRWNQNPNQQPLPQSKGAPLGGWDDEVDNPQGGFPGRSPMWKIEDTIPGIPSQSYPNYDKVPETSFDCRQQMFPGYYADLETQCQVFHICQADGRQNSFLCPTGTIFNQETFVCDWWFNVNCADSPQYVTRNDNLYKSPYLGIDGRKIPSYAQEQGRGIGRGQGIGGDRSQEGTFQPSSVGIPNLDSPNRGRNWPSDGQSRSNMKGDGSNPDFRDRRPENRSNRPSRMNQKGGMTGGPNFPNKNPNRLAGGSNRINPGMNRKGSTGQNMNSAWNQQAAHPRGNEKGGTGNNAWRQRGQMGMRNTNRGQVGTMKGDMWNPRRSAMQGGGNTRMGQNQNKGFDANSWSMRPQNFRATAQDRVGAGNEDWPNNHSPGEERNFPSNSKGARGSNHDFRDTVGHVNNQDGNWMNNGDGPLSNKNTLEGLGSGNQGFVRNRAWDSDNRFDTESSWQTNNQYRNNYAVDYDY